MADFAVLAPGDCGRSDNVISRGLFSGGRPHGFSGLQDKYKLLAGPYQILIGP